MTEKFAKCTHLPRLSNWELLAYRTRGTIRIVHRVERFAKAKAALEIH